MVALVVIGLIAVYSSSYALGALQFEDANYFIKRQAVWAAVGLLGLLVVMQIDYRRLLRPSPLLMLAAVLGLAAVLVPGLGVEQNGATRVDVALRPEDEDMELLPWIDPENFNPGYLMRAMDLLPRRGDKPEWQHSQDYWREKDEIPAIDLDGPEFVYG